MVRGLERRPIFHDREDREDLLDRLCRVLPDERARALAWAFMSNHIHLVVATQHGSLSRMMARINTGHARRFNQRHDRVGYLFQNRFRSRIVGGDGDLMNLVRYVHRNPIGGGIVASIGEVEAYPWCGHGALAGTRPAHAFESVDEVLSLFAPRRAAARRAMRRWMVDLHAPPRATMLEGDELEPAEPPGAEAAHELARVGAIEDVAERVAAELAVDKKRILAGSRERAISGARALIAYRAVVEQRIPVAEVAQALGVSPSAVSHAAKRVRSRGEREGRG